MIMLALRTRARIIKTSFNYVYIKDILYIKDNNKTTKTVDNYAIY